MKSISLTENLVPVDPKNVLGPDGRHYVQMSAKTLFQEVAEVYTKKRQTAIIGSKEEVYAMRNCDSSLLQSVLTAYNNHWNLRTSPEDWWFCVIRRVTVAIDKNSTKTSVRKFFVNHDRKTTLEVNVMANTIYDINYEWFFSEMSKKISDNVKVPEYVDAVTADFSITSSVQKIVSQITLMSSLKWGFNYVCTLLCGIPGVEMIGTEEDWLKLQTKLKILRKILKPIENDIGLTLEWWNLVDDVFCKLLATYRGHPDNEWWSRIVTRESFGSGCNEFSGWITLFLEGKKLLELSDCNSGLVTVPLTVIYPSGVGEEVTFVAGMLGFNLHTDDTTGSTPSVQPFQGWSLLLRENSHAIDQIKKRKIS